MAVKTVSTFTLPDEYQRQASEARRRRRMAEMLAQQAYQPGDIQNAPIPRGAPLVQGLQAFLAARAARKADEAEESAEEKASQIGSQIAGRLTGREIVPAAPVDAFGLQEFQSAAPAFAQDMQRRNAEEQAQLKAGDIQEVTRQSQYVYDPQDAMRLAMTRGGNAAMRGNPALAAMLSRMMEKPKEAEYGTTPQYDDQGRAYVVNNAGNVRYLKDVKAPKEARKPVVLSKEVDLGNVVELHYSDGSVKVRTKGLAPSAASAKVSEPTEGERKDAYNLQRIVNAAQTIKGATSTDPKAVSPGFMEAAVGMLPFAEGVKYRAQSPQRQVVDTAQTDLVDAFLTLATGAAYTAEQLQGQREALLPRYGESKESIAAKKQRVRALAEAAKVRAGRAWTPQMQGAIESVFGPLGEDEQVIKLPSRR
jgi:hypothetical protein